MTQEIYRLLGTWLGRKIINIVAVVVVRGGRRRAPGAIRLAATPAIIRKLVETV